MAKCAKCGKKGLLVKVNENGLCKDCEIEQARIEEQIRLEEERRRQIEAEQQYKITKEDFEKLGKGIDYITSDIAPDDINIIITTVEAKIAACDELAVLADSLGKRKNLSEILNDTMEPEEEYISSFIKFKGYPSSFSIYGSPREGISPSRFVGVVNDKLERYKKAWGKHEYKLKKYVEFLDVLEGLPRAEISIKEDAEEKSLDTSVLVDKVKFSSVTKSTNYEKTGYFVCVDTETTGLNTTDSEIIELAAVRYKEWQPVEVFETLIKPSGSIPEEASKVNNITDDMVADKPEFRQIVDSFAEFVGNSPLVGHNLLFDLKFLYAQGYDCLAEKRKYFDTLDIAKKTLKKQKNPWSEAAYDVVNYKLTTLCDFYDIRPESEGHRAAEDAMATAELFKRLANRRINK